MKKLLIAIFCTFMLLCSVVSATSEIKAGDTAYVIYEGTVNVTKKEIFTNGNIVVADRYTTSNMVHQASKIDDADKKSEFLDWLYDMEYEKLSLPKPDMVIFLDMPIEVSQRLLNHRYSEGGGKKDIHESDVEYLENCRKAALFTAEYSGWITVPCAKDGKPRGIEDISCEILERVL